MTCDLSDPRTRDHSIMDTVHHAFSTTEISQCWAVCFALLFYDMLCYANTTLDPRVDHSFSTLGARAPGQSTSIGSCLVPPPPAPPFLAPVLNSSRF